MYYHHYYVPHAHPNHPYRYPYAPPQQSYGYFNPFYAALPEEAMMRQHAISGQATWTEGGPVTECGISWSANNYMTAAVGSDTPYQCGQTLIIKNLSSADHKEISVKVVDQVAGYPANKVNLHRRAFEALGANPQLGVINVEINPGAEPETEQEQWAEYLSEVIEVAFQGYNIIGYHNTGKTKVSAEERVESFEFTLQSSQETRQIGGVVHYNPNSGRVLSMELKEV